MSEVLVGTVAPESPDALVAAHYGDPMREQRHVATLAAVVDRSHRGVLALTGPDRLSWLNSLTTQRLETLQSGEGTELLVLSPHGHIEHHAFLVEDGETTWLDVEPGDAGELLEFLQKMRFLMRVEMAEVTDEWALLSVLGPHAGEAVTRLGLADELPAPQVQPVPNPKFASVDVSPRPSTVYTCVALPGGGWARRAEHGYDLLVPRASAPETTEALGVPRAGIWAYEAMRVAARGARLGFETDHRTLPAEAGWLAHAVHLDKGCYRGQETVARVHHLGRPPRRLVLLHLDGITSDALPAHGAVVSTVDGRSVGFVGTAARHHELGMIALALVKQNVPDDARLRVGDVAAAIDPC